MTERDIPESWHPTRGRKPDEIDGVSRSPQVGDTQAFGVPAPGSANTVRQRIDYTTEELPINQQSPVTNITKKSFVKLPRWMQGLSLIHI